MPSEVWLRPNRRPALVLVCAAVAAAVLSGIVLAVAVWRAPESQPVTPLAVVASCVGAASVLAAGAAYFSAKRPRIYREGPRLRFRLAPRPLEVPFEVVEAFFLGQGPANLPGGLGDRLETVNLVVRLSQRATEWHQRDTDPRLGTWCGGYITVHGTCCEPLSADVAHRLNRLLSAAKREAPRDG